MSEDDTTIHPVGEPFRGSLARAMGEGDTTVWTVSAEFGVQAGATWQPCCAGCLPILVRRAHRRGWPLRILKWTGAPCLVRDPHPDPRIGVPPGGHSCPRPLVGLCLDAKCDHD